MDRSPGEIARLEAMRRIALGAAHTLNNAFAGILGELQFLLAERKGDAELEEACATIDREIQRCARLTRALCAGGVRGASGGETELVALARSSAALLRETLSRGIEISWTLPDSPVTVHGDRADLELLVLLVAHQLAQGAASGSRLRIALESAPPALDFELRAQGARAEPAPADALLVEALARDSGASIEATRGGARLRFAAATELSD